MATVTFHQTTQKEVSVFKETNKNEIMSLMKSCRICVDGNIGAGKTTFVKSLNHYLQKNGVDSQISEEDMSNKMKTLQLFINDQKKYAFAFQLMMLSERINIYKSSLPVGGCTTIIDRSLVGDFAFASHHHAVGNISDVEWVAYKEMLEKYSNEDFFQVPDYYLYLNVSPEVAYTRIVKRNRDGEASGYSLSYLQSISKSHELSFESLGVSYIEINWDENVEIIDGVISDEALELIFHKILETRLQNLK